MPRQSAFRDALFYFLLFLLTESLGQAFRALDESKLESQLS